MLKLMEDELEAGLNAIKHHGYSDFFPMPPEFDVVVNSWSAFKTYLADQDLDEYKAYRPSLELSAPKSVINLRRVTLLHPFDLIVFTSIVRILPDDIEAARIDESENRIFSRAIKEICVIRSRCKNRLPGPSPIRSGLN